MTVSAAFLVKDPPLDRLAALWALLRPYCAEAVIVVDDRTATGTAETMAAWPGVTLVPFSWCDDFSAARNAALPHCSGDWILHLDPDELPTPAMLEYVRAVDLSAETDVEWQGGVYRAARGHLFFTRNFFDGVQGAEWEEHWHCRLFRRTSGAWYRTVHELVMLDGLPESDTRNTPLLRKAPRAAGLIHSRMEDRAKDEQYAALSGATA